MHVNWILLRIRPFPYTRLMLRASYSNLHALAISSRDYFMLYLERDHITITALSLSMYVGRTALEANLQILDPVAPYACVYSVSKCVAAPIQKPWPAYWSCCRPREFRISLMCFINLCLVNVLCDEFIKNGPGLSPWISIYLRMAVDGTDRRIHLDNDASYML